jgi:hypothetical protein
VQYKDITSVSPTNRAFGAGNRDGIVFQKPKGMCFDGEAEMIFMRLNVACISLAECLILLAVGPTPLHAALRPSFNVDGCSWNATHIVLVQTTASEGVVSVVESWKGDLKPGDSIEVPELKPNQNAVAISSYPKPAGFDLQDKSGISEQIPRQPIGSRMVLFLKKQDGSGTATPVKWGPASAGGMKVSVLWIDGGKAFCFQQRGPMTVGPTTLSPCMRWPVRSSDVAVFTVRIQEVLQAQGNLAETLALKNVDMRADRLGSIALSDVYQAQREALDALGKAGTVALPAILQVMDKPPIPEDEAALMRVFVEAAGKDSGRQLHARLQQDVIYWKTIGPTLTPDWLDQLIVVGSPLEVKFQETSFLIRELDQEQYAPAAQTVAELHDFWVSQPQLYDPKWGNKQGEVRTSVSGLDLVHSYALGLAEQCDAFVKKVGRTN